MSIFRILFFIRFRVLFLYADVTLFWITHLNNSSAPVTSKGLKDDPILPHKFLLFYGPVFQPPNPWSSDNRCPLRFFSSPLPYLTWNPCTILIICSFSFENVTKRWDISVFQGFKITSRACSHGKNIIVLLLNDAKESKICHEPHNCLLMNYIMKAKITHIYPPRISQNVFSWQQKSLFLSVSPTINITFDPVLKWLLFQYFINCVFYFIQYTVGFW